MKELYKKHRPTKLSEIVGQEAAVEQLKALMKQGLPHCILLQGPSGCGKTTLARMLAKKLGCDIARDYTEWDAARRNGVDDARELNKHCSMMPMAGSVRVVVMDECHRLTKQAQESLLKLLEDTPAHTYIILATTDPQKLLATVKTRATVIQLASVNDTDMSAVLSRVIEKENMEVSDDVQEAIIDAAGGSPRKALVHLNTVAWMEDDKALATLQVKDNPEAFDIAKALVWDGKKPAWAKVKSLINGC